MGHACIYLQLVSALVSSHSGQFWKEYQQVSAADINQVGEMLKQDCKREQDAKKKEKPADKKLDGTGLEKEK